MQIESLRPPRGTRDWIGKEALKREIIIESVQKVCKLYGYSPIQTPSIERTEILESGYRGSQKPSFFRIMDRGESLGKRYAELLNFEPSGDGETVPLETLADMGLRYDLTIPTSRVIERYNLTSSFPLKRYQIGPIWRADKPSAGRLREFTVCDIDAFGTTNAIDDAEAILLINDIFESLGIPFEILVNNKKIITVVDEIQQSQQVGANDDIGLVENKIGNIPLAQEGIAELRQVFDILKHSHIKPAVVKFAPSLRRSVTYYIGTIIEARATSEKDLRSPINGGRYNETPGIFTHTLIPAVGLSMSIERMQVALGGISEKMSPNFIPDVLVVVSDINLVGQALEIATKFRSGGVRTMIHSNMESSLKDQMKFADRNSIHYVAIVKNDDVVIRNFSSGKQRHIDLVGGGSIDASYLEEI